MVDTPGLKALLNGIGWPEGCLAYLALAAIVAVCAAVIAIVALTFGAG